MDDNEALKEQVILLMKRMQELEERVGKLEGGASSHLATNPAPVGVATPKEGLAEAISQALTALGEGDVGAIRQAVAKISTFAGVTRSDINKVLYANKNLFEVARQDNMKPIWKLANEPQTN